MKTEWREGNRVELLENGEQFFPRVFEAIRNAKREVLVETFIIFDDEVGRELRDTLIEAAKRGLRVELTADGYGTADLGESFVNAMTRAGVRFHFFDPKPKFLGLRTNLFRRLHRKLVVIDGEVGFIGGLNFSRDHLCDTCEPDAKQDYAVEVEGPVVADLRALALTMLGPGEPRRWRWPWPRNLPTPAPLKAREGGGCRALLVSRDSHLHRNDIEQHYRVALRSARERVIIANAYFFPGYRFLRDLREAAQRGVQVQLILQGNPDKPSVRWAARTLYDDLLSSGAKIYEYQERPLHAKVAVVDGDWSTVGSSNLDPLSLFVNLEANLIIRDAKFNQQLTARLQRLLDEHCLEIPASYARAPNLLRRMLRNLAYHITRRIPRWSGLLPGHRYASLGVPPEAAPQAQLDKKSPAT